MADPDFCSWLHEMEAGGHEIVIHGFFHERARRRHEVVRAKILTRFHTADEGEFFDLSYLDALQRIRQARHDFEAHGFHPHGFIAPAWLLGAEAERAAIDACMDYTTTIRTIRDFAEGRIFTSQSLVYSVRSAWRRVMSLAWNRLLFRHQAKNPLLRLGIHPPDIGYRAIWNQITRLIDEALRDRRPMTYESWLGEKSAAGHEPSAIQ